MFDAELHAVTEVAPGVFGTLLAPCSTRVLPYLLVPAPTSFVWLVAYHPHHVVEWLDLPLPLAPDSAPELELVPSRLWIMGLGHLGQAFLWALGVLPVPRDSGLELVLQDTDVISRSTVSTSILTDPSMIGIRKTRAMAAWPAS